MKLELIGNPLGHSWSPEIHRFFLKQDYHLHSLEEDELNEYFCRRDFDGINVTIPYKEKVIPFLDETDEAVEEIGAVNCIVNNNGKLTGHNTDWEGFRDMIHAHGIEVQGRKIAVLGSGGASKAVYHALKTMGAYPQIVSRTVGDGRISYDDLYKNESEYSLLVNATPVGMFPNTEKSPIDLSGFTSLEAVVDIIANPLRTKLMFQAETQHIAYAGGFEMLVRQAFIADQYFTGKELDAGMIEPCMNTLLTGKRNIVLIGMPTSGKTTVASLLSEKTGMPVCEMDDEIVKRIGTSIADCFKEKGEAYFRSEETKTASEHRIGKGEIISCGGGAVTTPETMRYLSENGIVVWIRRELSQLYPTESRPLSTDTDAIARMYRERTPLYGMYSDITVDNSAAIEDTAAEIIQKTGIKEKRRIQ